MASSIKDAVGKAGKVFRLGGDEFIAVVKPCDETICNDITEKTSKDFARKSEELGITVSAAYGIAIREGEEESKSLIERADKKMYECKQAYYQQERHDRRCQ